MLPSSHRKTKHDVKIDNIMTLGDLERYYKKNEDAKSNTSNKSRKNVENHLNELRVRGTTNSSDSVNDLYEIMPSHIESIISDSVPPYDDKESEYDDKYNNGLSIKKHKMANIKYPFSNNSSVHFIHDADIIYDDVHKNNSIDGENTEEQEFLVEYLVYYINTSSYKPFLEFMLYKPNDDNDDNDNNKLFFPNFSYNMSSSTILEDSSILLDNLFGIDTCIFKGRIIESPDMNPIKSAHINKRVILLYHLREKNSGVVRYTSSDSFWWCTVNELFNHRKVLFYDISDTVTDLFLAYPQALKLYHKESLIETPIVVFNGADNKTAKYNAVFSIKKSDIESRYGPYYYFTDLHSSMRYACYNIETHEKYAVGGLVRFVIFPGKMKMFIEKNKPDKSEMAKFICEQYPIEKKTLQFRDNDCIWTEQYNSAYNGKYEFVINPNTDILVNSDDDLAKNDSSNTYESNGRSSIESDHVSDINRMSDVKNNENIYYLAMRICIREYIFQTPLSYYYINTDDIPNNYEYEFKKYKIV